ncbi:MAG TPA: hypothetical protein DEP45_10180 [Armatimonadetes bacterium]|nr:hypothetical protein [Armatimonadota bacterium]
MTGHELVSKVRDARQRRDAIVLRVCGACESKCCKQMTMMGTQDLRRLVREMMLDEEFERHVREGLREVADELEADLLVLREVTELLGASVGTGRPEDLAELRHSVEEWGEFVHWLRSDFPISQEEMLRIVRFPAVRSNALNALSRFSGGLGALVTLSGSRASFRFHGRRIAPPPCLFYLDASGCICDHAKPAKCANFFCTGVPNLLEELRKSLGFDDFVLANVTPVTIERIISMMELERNLGPEYVEPKIVLGASEEMIDRIARRMGQCGETVRVRRIERGGLRSAAEVEAELNAIPPGTGLLEVFPSLDGNTLYEMALALDRIRLRDDHPSYVMAATELKTTPASHPLWDDQMMAQPLGVLDIFAIDA